MPLQQGTTLFEDIDNFVFLLFHEDTVYRQTITVKGEILKKTLLCPRLRLVFDLFSLSYLMNLNRSRMLKLLHRHVFKEILVATLLAMALFVFVLLAGNALRDMIGLFAAGKLDALTFLRFIGYLIPYVAAYALPLAILTGTLVALGRLSSQREITAMKSSGWSLYQVAAPVVCIAFIGMVGSILVNLHYAPRSKVAARTLLARAITDNPLDFIEEKRFINEFPGYVIYMGAKEEEQLRDFWVWELDDDKKVKRFVRAATGQLGFNAESSELILRVFNATAEIREESNPEGVGSDQMQTVFLSRLTLRFLWAKLLEIRTESA